MYVIGTAGHVDHGKSTLIQALTGIDPDRLQEEKQRQMTIELGFAWTTLPSGQDVGFVDVPGHRDFIENMLAGVGGLDAVLFIVAADEGVMPQTKEHLSILDLLGVKNGIVVLTKVDLVEDAEWISLVKSDIRDLVSGTTLENTPIIGVSAKENIGLNELETAIDDLLKVVPEKKDYGRPRLPVDRVFSLKGFGTIVTGTLSDGKFNSGSQVVIQPKGLPTRIRGLETHKKKTLTAFPGSRTALNITNVDVTDITRGDVITLPGLYQPTSRIDCVVNLLSAASNSINHNQEVKIFTGASQTLARVRVLGKKEIKPGETGYIQLELKKPIAVHFKDRFILRRPSPPETIAGGRVLDCSPKGRHRRKDMSIVNTLQTLGEGDTRATIDAVVESEDIISLGSLIDKIGIDESEIIEVVKSSIKDSIYKVGSESKELDNETLLISMNKWGRIKEKIIGSLKEFHQSNSLKRGVSTQDLLIMIGRKKKHWAEILDDLRNQEIIQMQENIVWLQGFNTRFSPDQEKQKREIITRFNDSPYSPPSFESLESDFDAVIINALLDSSDLIKTSNGIIFAKEHFNQMLEGTKKIISEKGKITLAQFRDTFKTSRKFAASFLEYLDNKHITERRGDFRILKHIDK